MPAALPPAGACIIGLMPPDLEFLFHPGSIAVVGAPSDPANIAGGSVFVMALLDSGYRGHI